MARLSVFRFLQFWRLNLGTDTALKRCSDTERALNITALKTTEIEGKIERKVN